MDATLTSAQLLVSHWQTVETLPVLSGSASYAYALPYRIEIQRLGFDTHPLFAPVPPPAPLVVDDKNILAWPYTQQHGEEDRDIAEMGLANVRRLLHEAQAVPDSLRNLKREELAALALQAKGNWQAGEGDEPAVTIVRRLRAEWK